MRALSKEEQDLCNRILKNSGRNNFIGNIIDDKLSNILIELKRPKKELIIHYPIQSTDISSEVQEKLIERIEEISELILTTVNLIKMLVEEGYIMLLQRGSEDKTTKFGRGIGNIESVTYDFKDLALIELFTKYSNKEIYATKEFEHFCNDKFIPRQEKRIKRQTNIATGILIVAFFALILNTIIFLFGK